MKYYKIFFGILVLSLLVIPLFHMNTAEITEQENRTLAKFPEISKEGKLNEYYGKDFEAWLGDRFWGRDQLIDARFQALYKINGRVENEKAFVGDDGWMFLKYNTVNRPSVEKQKKKIEEDVEVLKRFADKFKDKNIPIYLVLIPEREVLYQKYWERYYKPKPYLDYGDEITKLLRDTSINIIYPKSDFLLERKDTFLKNDSHLNFVGGNLIGRAFFKELKKLYDVSETWTMGSKKSKRKYIANILGITDDYEELDFPLDIETNNLKENIIIKNEKDRSWPVIKKGGKKNSGIKKDVFIIGNCYGLDILWPISAKLFENANFYRINYKEDWPTVEQFLLQDIALPNEKIIILIGSGSIYKFLEYFLVKN